MGRAKASTSDNPIKSKLLNKNLKAKNVKKNSIESQVLDIIKNADKLMGVQAIR